VIQRSFVFSQADSCLKISACRTGGLHRRWCFSDRQV